MSEQQILLKVTRVTDDDIRMYAIGELDFGVPASTHEWLSRGDNRERLASYLRSLAHRCKHQHPPFGDRPMPGQHDILRGEEGEG